MLKAFGGIIATTVGAVVVYFLVGDNGVLNNKPKEAMGGSIQSISAENLSPCCTWNVRVQIEGLNGQTCELFYQIVDANTGRTGSVQDLGGFGPEADKDAASSDFEVPISRPGRYYIHFMLADPKGVKLDEKNSSAVNVY